MSDDRPQTSINTDGGASIGGDGHSFEAGRSQVFGGVLNDQSTNVDSITSDVTVIGSGNTVSVNLEDRAYFVGGLSPFRGLLAYTYAERGIYAGREQQVRAATLRLTGSPPLPLLFVIGASGSGKSSFAQAGLIPALQAHYQPQQRSLKYTVFHPGEHPNAALCRALPDLALSPDFAEELPVKLPDAASLNQFLNGGPRQQVNLVIIDQFEELFTQSVSDEREWLLGWLAALPPFAQSRTHVVCTMRSDYLPTLFERGLLYDAAKAGVDLRRMSVADLEAAIQQPLSVNYPDKRFEPALLTRLATDAAADPTYLPLLQATLDELWRGGSLRDGAYRGDIGAAISRRADEVLAYRDGDRSQPRPADEQAAVMTLLLDLVQVSPDQEFSDTRQQRSYAALVGDSRTRARLVAELSAERLLSTDGLTISTTATSSQSETQVNIIHESLIKNWGSLQAAIKEQQARLIRRERFEQAVAEWEQQGRNDSYLLTGIRLAEAEELAASSDVAVQTAAAQELLARSVAAAAEEEEGLRLLLAETETARVAIAQQLRVSESRRLASEGQRHLQDFALEDNLQQALLLGYQAVATNDNVESRRLLNAAVAGSALPILTLEDRDSRSNSAMFDPSGQFILVSGADGRTCLWTKEGVLLSILEGQYAATISGNGQRIITSDTNGFVHLWDLQANQLGNIHVGEKRHLTSFGINSDGSRIVTVAVATEGDEQKQSNTASLWDSTGRLLKVLAGHTDTVTYVAFSPDDKLLLTAARDHTVRLWDSNGRLKAVLKGHNAFVNKAMFTSNSRYVLTAAGYSFEIMDPGATSAWGDNTARLWSVDGKLLTTFKGHQLEVLDASISPSGSQVATASYDHTAMVWDRSTGQLLARLVGHREAVNTVSYNPDGSLILTASADGTARLWSADGSQVVTLAGHKGSVTKAEFSPDGKLILTASVEGEVRLWQITDPLLPTLVGHKSSVLGGLFDTRGRLITGSIDATLIWNESGGCVGHLAEKVGTVVGLTPSHNGDYFITRHIGEEAYMWSADGRLLRVLGGHSNSVSGVQFSEDDQRILTSAADGTLYLWNAAGRLLTRLIAHDDGSVAAVFQPSTSCIVAVASTNLQQPADWRVYSPDGGAGVRQRNASTGSVRVAPGISLWSKDGAFIKRLDGVYLIGLSASGLIMTSDEQHTFLLSKDGSITARCNGRGLGISPDGGVVAVFSPDRMVRMWRADNLTDNVIGSWQVPATGLADFTFSPNNEQFVAVDGLGVARLWNVDGSLVATLNAVPEQGEQSVNVIFSSDGTYLAVSVVGASNHGHAPKDDVARLFASDGRLLCTFKGRILCFTPDNTRILVAKSYGPVVRNYTVQYYPINSNDLLAIAARRITRDFTETELQLFAISSSAFDAGSRPYPPQVSWQQGK